MVRPTRIKPISITAMTGPFQTFDVSRSQKKRLVEYGRISCSKLSKLFLLILWNMCIHHYVCISQCSMYGICTSTCPKINPTLRGCVFAMVITIIVMTSPLVLQFQKVLIQFPPPDLVHPTGFPPCRRAPRTHPCLEQTNLATNDGMEGQPAQHELVSAMRIDPVPLIFDTTLPT